jgi:DNA-binding SARP family transcriptional activator
LDTAVFQQTIPQQPERALKLYRGDFLGTIQVQEAKGFVEWAALEREQHRLLALETLLQVIKKHEASGQIEKAIPFAKQLVTIEPHHEGWHRQLMNLYLLAGQHEQAETQFETCRQIMQEIFHQEPSPATQSLLIF